MFTNIFDHKNVFDSIDPAFEKIEYIKFFFLFFFGKGRVYRFTAF